MGKLSLKDLLDPVQGEEVKDGGPSTVTQQFLEAGSQKVEELPLRKQLQIKRESTYRTTQQEGDKWIGIVKLNRQKDSLNFVKREKDNAASVAYFPSTPLSPFHNKIQQQLKSLQLQSQSAVIKKEQESLGQVSKQQARRRLKQARKQRSLVLQEQVKNRRIAKIKSKLYRKIKKRQKNREQAKRIENLDPQQRTQFLQKLAKQRIHERITLRHKTKNRYITDLLRFGKGNKNSVQQSINQVNRIRREQLQKANEGFAEQLSQQFDEQNYREQALEELQKELDDIEDAAEDDQQLKGIEGMKFMKIGREKQLKQAKDETRGLLKMLQEGNEQQQQIEEQQPIQAQVTRGKYGANINQAETESKPKANYTEKNFKKFLQIQHNPQQLTQGIDISKLKEKYQPNRVELDLKQAIQDNRDLFINSNQAIAENFREFQANKADELIAQLPEQPKKQKGWGSWAGPGISEPKVNHALEVKKKIAKIEQIKKKRRDSQMAGVIVRESYNKNLKDYFVSKVPAGYSSAEQFEYLQDERLGPEWNSLGQFRVNVKPKVVTQAGQVIQPVRLPKNLEKSKH